MNAENSPKKQRGRPFKKGQSGNPSGKPLGTRNKATRAALTLLHGQLEELTQAAINKALEGDMVALRLVMDKVLPTCKEAPIDPGTLQLPSPVTADNASTAMAEVLNAVASGNITPGQGAVLIGMVREVARVGMPDVVVSTGEHQISPATKAALDRLFDRD